VKPEALLEHIAGTLRHEIGPAVDESFPKTQAFMASVILEKLAGQVRLADTHARADRDDRAALEHDLRLRCTVRPVPDCAPVVALADGDRRPLELVGRWRRRRDELGAEQFDLLITRVRRTLRARLDRQLEYAS
jgi:hypothetical protein